MYRIVSAAKQVEPATSAHYAWMDITWLDQEHQLSAQLANNPTVPFVAIALHANFVQKVITSVMEHVNPVSLIVSPAPTILPVLTALTGISWTRTQASVYNALRAAKAVHQTPYAEHANQVFICKVQMEYQPTHVDVVRHHAWNVNMQTTTALFVQSATN